MCFNCAVGKGFCIYNKSIMHLIKPNGISEQTDKCSLYLGERKVAC